MRSPADPTRPRLLLVDGSYYAFRSFHAIQSLHSPDGRPVNALFGMVKALKRMLADLAPTHAAVAFDIGPPAARLEIQPDYKASRADTPPDLEAQLPLIQQTVPLLGFHALTAEGEEADDLMASYTRAATNLGWQTILATNDKDLMQLVSPSCSVYCPGKEGFSLLGPAEVEEKWGVPPNLIGDLLALTGDASDNIPGLPGVGPKTAAKWLQQNGSLEALLANPDLIPPGKLRDAFLNAKPLLETNRRMVALRDQLPLPVPLNQLTLTPDWSGQADLFRSLRFRSFLREAEAALNPTPPPTPTSSPRPVTQTQTELFT